MEETSTGVETNNKTVPGGILNLGSDEGKQVGQQNRAGIRLETKEIIDTLQCRLSAQTAGVITAYLTDDSGTVIERQTVATLKGGDTFEFEAALKAGKSYRILCDAQGYDYSRGRTTASYPLESDSLVVTHGIYNGSGAPSNTYRYCIDQIRTSNTAAEKGAAIDLATDDETQSWNGLNKQSGVRIETTASIDGLICRLSENTTGLTTAYLTTDSGDVLERQTIATLEAGNSFTFDTSLAPAEAYWIICDARGDDYIRGRAEVTYPVRA
ncbi:hypothetical protein ACFQE6_07770, partial [Natrinema soli]